MEVVPFAGWERNAKLVCNDVEMIVTLEVGPRIISYGFAGGPNEMAVHEKEVGKTGGDEFRAYGGHRLWIGPEEQVRTYQPDNDPVDYKEEGGYHVFTSKPDQFHMQKEMRIKPDPQRGCFLIECRVYNHSAYAHTFCPWTPTQFAPGGECIFPQPEFIPWGKKYLPARPLVLWNYTLMDDPRWTFGRRVVRLKNMDMGPTKAGALVHQGITTYANHGNVHVRRFECQEGAPYPDFGCNFETFTRWDFLEVETLGPMQSVEPGAYATHLETWYLLRETPPAEDEACAKWLEELQRTKPL